VAPCREISGDRDSETVTHVLELAYGPHRHTLRQPYMFVSEDDVVRDVRKWIAAKARRTEETATDAAGEAFYRELGIQVAGRLERHMSHDTCKPIVGARRRN
jgi:hypothetical protein